MLLVLSLAGQVAIADTEQEDSLYRLIGERLGLMRSVAAYKWVHALPVEDLERERLVVEAAVADGLRRSLQTRSSARFFQTQIEAAKDIQAYWFTRWARGGGPRSAPDLSKEIRPQLLELGRQIVDKVRETDHDPVRFGRIVSVEGLHPARGREVFEALTAMRRYATRLEQILDSGIIRVGTTGDYAPFSYTPISDANLPPGAQPQAELTFHGIDIDLAADLADALGVRLSFVHTSWPSLLSDLESGAYDIAMSGVSRTVARQQAGFLSEPYFVGGKTPIARCDQASRFNSLETIDRPDVKVIVNPGGTNESFVRDRLHQAEVVLHTDNRTIFDALEAGGADVMITDRIEVKLQTRHRPTLCSTMSGTLSYQEKGYLMPADRQLKDFVDSWLSSRMSDGTVAGLIEQHLEE